MSQGSLRFMHAANARLDGQPRGTGPLTGDARRVAEDSTLIAIERLADACVEQDVDFLLLSGETFAGSPTLRARRTLLSAFEALAEFGVTVYWEAPGAMGPEWDRIAFRLPANVVPLRDDDTEPVAFVKEGRVASILSPHAPDSDHRSPTSECGTDAQPPFRIGRISGASSEDSPAMSGDVARGTLHVGQHYISVGRASRPSTLRDGPCVIHAPGTIQGLSIEERGPCGASLVVVDAQGSVNITPVALAPLRWEEIRIAVDSRMTEVELIDRMQYALLEIERFPGDEVCIIRWVMVGAGPLFESLANSEISDAIFNQLNSESGLSSGVGVTHELRLRRRRRTVDDSLIEELTSRMEECADAEFNALLEEISDAAATSGLIALSESLERVSNRKALDAAEGLVHEWMMSGRE